MRIWLDPDKAAAYDLSAGDVLALRAQNLQVSAAQESTSRRWLIEQFGDIIVKSDDRGRVTRARHRSGRGRRCGCGSAAYQVTRSNAATLVIYAQPGANRSRSIKRRATRCRR